jgi:YD repeat-containing protein
MPNQSRHAELTFVPENTDLRPDGSSIQKSFGLDPLTQTSSYLFLTRYDGFASTLNDYESRSIQRSADGQFSLTKSRVLDSRIETSVYESASKTETTTTPLGFKLAILTDAFEKPVQIQFGNFTPVEYLYDTRGRISQVKQGRRITAYAYSPRGDLTSMTSALGHVTSFDHDLSSRLVTTKLPDDRIIGTAYTPNSDPSSIITPDHLVHSFLYGVFDLITNYQAPSVSGDQAQISYIYNEQKELTGIVRPDSRTHSITRDAAGRIQYEGDSDSYISTSYDSSGRVKTLASSDGISITKSYVGPQRHEQTVHTCKRDIKHLDRL